MMDATYIASYEREVQHGAARKVYCLMCDLIRAEEQLLINYFKAGCPIGNGYEPENYPVYSDFYNEIRKLCFDLPRMVFGDLIRLAQSIFGSWNLQLDEACADIGIDERIIEFEKWLGRPFSQYDYNEWCNFAFEHALENYDLLDEILADYLY